MLTEPSSVADDKPAAILFVDDEANVLKALRRLFHDEHYATYFASSGAEGLEILQQNAVDLIISDMRMPEMNGAEFLTQVVNQWPETIRILLTGYSDLQSTIDAVNKGRIYNYCNKPWNDEELKLLVRNALEQKRLREEKDRLSGIVQQQNEELKELVEQLKNAMQHLDRANENLKKQYIDSIRAFSRIIEMRPGIKSGQSKYIAEKSLLVARKLNMDKEEKKNILYAGLLIQIGKMSLPDRLLSVPFYKIPPLDKQNYLKHAVEGEALLNGLTQLQGASILIRHQYERYDGSGFPDHLAKEDIPLGSRIINVVGDYISYLEGSMTGKVMPVIEVIDILISRKETYYDPVVVDSFIEALKENVDDIEAPPEPEKKSWRNSKLFVGAKESASEVARPVIEISWTQLKPDMDIESVYFGNKLFIRNCSADPKLIHNITAMRESTGIEPAIRIRLGAK